MKFQKSVVTGICLAVVAVAMAASPSSVLAQGRNTPADLRSGKVTFAEFSNRRASRNMSHARDYARDLQNYSGAITSEPTILRSDVEQLGHNIKTAQQQVVTVRKQVADDKEVQTSFDSVEKHLATAAGVHKTLLAECQKDTIDAEACAHCGSEITNELDKALAEHAAIMTKLGIESEVGQTPKPE